MLVKAGCILTNDFPPCIAVCGIRRCWRLPINKDTWHVDNVLHLVIHESVSYVRPWYIIMAGIPHEAM